MPKGIDQYYDNNYETSNWKRSMRGDSSPPKAGLNYEGLGVLVGISFQITVGRVGGDPKRREESKPVGVERGNTGRRPDRLVSLGGFICNIRMKK